MAMLLCPLILTPAIYAKKNAGIGKVRGGNSMQAFPSGKKGSYLSPTSRPPGLKQNPYGLMKQGKTPAGWSKGIKKGWTCSGSGTSKRICLDGNRHQKICRKVNNIWFCK